MMSDRGAERYSRSLLNSPLSKCPPESRLFRSMPPLLSSKNCLPPTTSLELCNSAFNLLATSMSWSPSRLSNMITSAPAAMACLASSSDCTSTSILNENPPVDLAAATAAGIDPVDQMWLSLSMIMDDRS